MTTQIDDITTDKFYAKLAKTVQSGNFKAIYPLTMKEPNGYYEEAQTYAFEQAIEYSRTDVIAELISEQVAIRDYYLTRAAYISSDSYYCLGADSVVDLLLKNGAKPSNDPRVLNNAIHKGDARLINKLIHEDSDLVASCKTCIETVATTGSLAILDMLINYGGDKLITFTAFENAIKHSKFSVMNKLYEAVKLRTDFKSDFVADLLNTATKHSNLAGVAYMLERPDCTQVDKDTALKWAVHYYANIERVQANNLHQYPDIITLLIDKGATFKLADKKDILDLPFKMTDALKNDLKVAGDSVLNGVIKNKPLRLKS